MANIKLKELLDLDEYYVPIYYGGKKSKADIAKAKERAENRDKWYKEKVKNPDTGNMVSVKTALRYDKNHPARIAAVKMGKEKFKVGGFGYSDHFTRSGKPVKKKETEKKKEEPKQNIFGKLKNYFK